MVLQVVASKIGIRVASIHKIHCENSVRPAQEQERGVEFERKERKGRFDRPAGL